MVEYNISSWPLSKIVIKIYYLFNHPENHRRPIRRPSGGHPEAHPEASKNHPPCSQYYFFLTPFKESSLIFISYYLTHFSLWHSFLHIYFDAFLCKTLLLMKILAIIHVIITLFQQMVEYIISSWWSFNVLSIE